jgi:hypothetical protein
MTDRLCKCNHLRSEHHEGILHSVGECDKCNCSVFMSRDLPNRLSKISVMIGIIIIGFGVFTIGLVSQATSMMTDEDWNKPMEITTGQYLEKLLTVALAVIILGIIWVFQLFIMEYFSEKNRRVRE